MRLRALSSRSAKMVSGCALLAPMLFGASSALAQTSIPPPERIVRDQNGVDLATGAFSVDSPSISIGASGAGGLSFQQTYSGNGNVWRHNLEGSINFYGSYPNPTWAIVTLMGVPYRFDRTYYGDWVDAYGSGATFTFNNSPPGFSRLTTRDGSVAIYSSSLIGFSPTEALNGRIISLTRPSGEVLTFDWKVITPLSEQRLQSVTNNFGYQIKFDYPDNTALEYSAVRAINNAVDYCDPMANACTLTKNWPSFTFAKSSDGLGSETTTITDNLGAETRYVLSYVPSTPFLSIRRPTSSVNNVTYTISSGGGAVVLGVNNGAGAWSYSRTQIPVTGEWVTTVSDPLSHTRAYTVDFFARVIESFTNGVGQTWQYSYDSFDRLTSIEAPEGNETVYTYDARGNILTARRVAKPGSGLSDTVVTADFDASCTSPTVFTCNQANWIEDARGARTDFSYDGANGNLLTATSPAPTGGAVRPQTRYAYQSFYAYYKDATGSIVQAPSSISRLTSTSACAILSSCANGADEQKTSLTYGSTGVANNLLPISLTSGSGDGALAATVATTYTALGNPETIDGPLSGGNDITRFRYDDAGQLIGVVGPDPDGGGPRKHRATRNTYNLDGQVTAVESGTVNGWTDSDWAAFTPILSTTTSYNAQALPSEQRTYGGGALQSLSQLSYDAAGRLECAAARINLSASPPSSACTVGISDAGNYDRIVKQTYDAADRVLQTIGAFGTGSQAQISAATYTTNGRQATFADGNGNLSTFEYDGLDRLRKIRFPTAANGTISSTTDYEEYGFDPNDNVTSTRLRDGTSIGATFDALNRQTFMDAPSGTSDVTYTYDNLNRMLSAATSQTLSYTFDALDRMTSATSPLGTMSYQYDLAGRRERMTWPDSFYVAYDFNLYDDVLAIRENGASSGAGVLATFAYDDLGRRTDLTRGNGVVTTYAYDNASRLSTLTTDLSGSTNDYNATFSYSALDDQLSRTTTNSTFVHTPTSGTANYATNGLNQYTSVGGGATNTYDALGNLTYDGTRTFAYDALNRLTSGPGGASFSYDPLGRLYEQSSVAVPRRNLYDGVDLAGEYAPGSATLLKRYVFGPGDDEALVAYTGSGTSSRSWLTADERGSILAETDGSGAATAINKYDAFGIPASGNTSRFQYTGQAWLPDVGLYYYKARVYDPVRGRFLQTDPISYAGGPNLYAYAGNNPVNFSDPLGLWWGDCAENDICVTSQFPDNSAAQDAISRRGSVLSVFGGGGGIGSAIANLLIPEAAAETPQNSDIVVTARRPHHYTVNSPLCMCSPDEAFNMMRNFSAPGAPYAEDGRHQRILTGGNPILQTVDPVSRTITNVTQPGHFFGGQVQMSVTYRNGISSVSIVGSGIGPHAELNQILGPAIFRTLATSAFFALNPDIGTYP